MNKIFNKKIIFIFFIIGILAIGIFSVSGAMIVEAQEEGILTDTQMLQRAVDEIQGGKVKEESFIPVRSDEEIKRIMESSPKESKKQTESNQEKLKEIRKESLNELREKASQRRIKDTNPEFVPLAPIKDVIEKNNTDLKRYLNGMFTFGIIIAGFLAVVMIAVGGIQYMSTDAVSGKGEGRERITYALMGLLLVLFSYILLKTINPDILDFGKNILLN